MKSICQLLLLFFSMYVHAQQVNTESLRQKTITLRRFLEQNHYQPLKWSDTSSILLYNKWLKELDDEKLFFTQADLSVLETYKTRLDDEMMGKGWEFFNKSTALYKAGLQRADSLIQSILTKPFDLSKPDNIVWPAGNFVSGLQELDQRWRKFLKWGVLEYLASKSNDEEKPLPEQLPADFAKLEMEAREKIRKKERTYVSNLLKTPQLFAEDMQEEYLNVIAWCYDPHTSYMSIGEKKEFETAMSASEYSAGFDLQENDRGEKTISFLQPGGSAWRSGQLHTGDLLVKVKSGSVEKNVADIDDDAELDKLLGGSNQDELEVTIKTAAGEIKTVKLVKEKITDEEGIVKSYVLRGDKNIGYINLPGFYSREDESITDEDDIKYDGCANDVSKEIVKLKKDSVSGLILDLRYNGGGSMWEAMQLAGIFIDIGPVASVKDKDGKVHFLKDPNRGTIYDGPLLILVNGASASASEFVSAVLQDYNRAIIAGGTTYGKGTAQVVLPMDTIAPSNNKTYTDFVKVTRQKFYRVNGNTTQWKGVIPDIELPDVYADEFYKERASSSALQPDKSREGIYRPLLAMPVQELKIKSEQRALSNSYFKGINDFSKWLNEYRTGRTIPLQWNSYSVHYQKTMKMFRQLSRDEQAQATAIRVTNNGFDSHRINLSTTHSREINNTYLELVQKDMLLVEAYKIMIDWIGK